MSDPSWVFADPPDLGAITTRQVFYEGQLLSLVSHDPEGDWQFLHDEESISENMSRADDA